MNRKPVVLRLNKPQGRELVISDLHGSYDLYIRLLEKMQYTAGKDRLILLGDLMEKGSQNLQLLRKIMKQCETENVIAMMGNCDFTAKNVLFSYRLDFLKQVLLARKNSVIHEMIEEAGLPPLNENTDMEQLCQDLRKLYLKELAFLNDLPHMIITPSRIYAHAALPDETKGAEDFKDLMTGTGFARTGGPFLKTVVVGHLPVTEYCTRIADFNPMFDRSRNILSIDGGNQVKHSGQLNGVIFSNNYMQTVSVDDLPRASVRHSISPRNPLPFYLNWNNSQVSVIKRENGQILLHSSWLRRNFWMDSEVFEKHGAADYTNYQIPLAKGDIVSVCHIAGKKALVKKNGLLGWTALENLKLHDSQSV